MRRGTVQHCVLYCAVRCLNCIMRCCFGTVHYCTVCCCTSLNVGVLCDVALHGTCTVCCCAACTAPHLAESATTLEAFEGSLSRSDVVFEIIEETIEAAMANDSNRICSHRAPDKHDNTEGGDGGDRVHGIVSIYTQLAKLSFDRKTRPHR